MEVHLQAGENTNINVGRRGAILVIMGPRTAALGERPELEKVGSNQGPTYLSLAHVPKSITLNQGQYVLTATRVGINYRVDH